ncbi:hypothetical protein DIPPA_34768 [Diplonema papillatum]|nr:hypothetical protein DIPPA_34768 [Diplonema papillatum]
MTTCSQRKDGLELHHWMGDEKSKAGWVNTSLRDGGDVDASTHMYQRRGKIQVWKDLLAKKPVPRKRASKYSPEEASKMLVAFQKGSMHRQGMMLTCHVTGQTLPYNEIVRASGCREEMVCRALVAANVARSAIQFTPPSAPVPTFVSAEEFLGEDGEKYRSQAQIYSDEALRNYKQSMQEVIQWAANNMNDGPAKVNKVLMQAIPEIRAKSAAVAREVPLVKIDMPSEEEQEEMFNEHDSNNEGALSVGSCMKAVTKRWPTFTHKLAITRAFKLADGGQTGRLMWEGEGNSELGQFTRFLKYVQQYTEFWDRFHQYVPGARRLDLQDWLRLAPKVLNMGEASKQSLEQMFREIDSDNSGYVEVGSVCIFAAKVQGDAELKNQTANWQPSRATTWFNLSRNKSWGKDEPTPPASSRSQNWA